MMRGTDFQDREAKEAFKKALKQGRLTMLASWFSRKCSNYLLSLSMLEDIVPPLGETYVGVVDIPVKRIIGSENRVKDFASNFYPVNAWMARRWETVYKLLHFKNLPEAIKVIEYGGYYFIRDGHHRTSVARASGIEYLSAEVRRYNIPVDLPPKMSYEKISLFQEKYRLQIRTGIFDTIPESEFFVQCASNWSYLEKEIFTYHKRWFVDKHDREPHDNAELLVSWNKYLYQTAIKYFRRNSITYLFPGKQETDILCDMIRLWNSFPDSNGIWLQKIYKYFVEQASRKYFVRAAFYNVVNFFKQLRMSEQEEYEFFIQASQLNIHLPDAELPRGDKGYYRFLYWQLFTRHAATMRKRLGRAAYISELIKDWYETVVMPFHELYEYYNPRRSFPRLYTGFMKRYYAKVESGALDLEEAFLKYGHECDAIKLPMGVLSRR